MLRQPLKRFVGSAVVQQLKAANRVTAAGSVVNRSWFVSCRCIADKPSPSSTGFSKNQDFASTAERKSERTPDDDAFFDESFFSDLDFRDDFGAGASSPRLQLPRRDHRRSHQQPERHDHHRAHSHGFNRPQFNDDGFGTEQYERTFGQSRPRRPRHGGDTGRFEPFDDFYEGFGAGESLEQIDWTKKQMESTITNVYAEHRDVTERAQSEIDEFLKKHDITVKGENFLRPVFNFTEAGFSEDVLSSYLGQFDRPTPIQSVSWPTLLSGRDLVGVSQTGSGKTLAFLLPALMHWRSQDLSMARRRKPSVLIVAPTRELAQQVTQVSRELQRCFRHRTVCLFGGVSKRPQANILLRGVDVIVATPGRLLDLLEEGTADLTCCAYLVLDEADRMLDMGFEPQIRRIVGQMRPVSNRQTLMFTATWPKQVRRLARDFLKDDNLFVNIGSMELAANENITQHVHVLQSNFDKFNKLIDILNDEEARAVKEGERGLGKVLIFTNTKRMADNLARLLRQSHRTGGPTWRTARIHGDRSQRQRDTVMNAFRSGHVQVMIATDVAARGIDVDDIQSVVVYDFPMQTQDYVHRIGRTGRNQSGTAHTLFTEDDARLATEFIQVLNETEQNVPAELRQLANQKHHRRKHQGRWRRHGRHRYGRSRSWSPTRQRRRSWQPARQRSFTDDFNDDDIDAEFFAGEQGRARWGW